MDDSIIRLNYHKKRLANQHRCDSTLVVDELGIQNGKCRADIAVINGRMTGIEIKSDRDTLDRLPAQVDAYNKIFDFIMLVSGPKHIDKAKMMIPNWWGLIEATIGPRSAINFRTVRRAKLNNAVDDSSVARLLWKSESLAIVEELGLASMPSRANKKALSDLLASNMTSKILRAQVRDALKSRLDWRDQGPPVIYGG